MTNDFRYDAKFDNTLGDDVAPVTLVAYESVTCPHCREYMETVFPRLQSEYIDEQKLLYVMREVYFDQAGLMAGMAMRAVPKDRYFRVVETLFAEQENWLSGGDLSDIADKLISICVGEGANADEVVDKMRDEDLARTLTKLSNSHMATDNVQGTPTLIINGQTAASWDLSTLEPMIDEQVSRKLVV